MRNPETLLRVYEELANRFAKQIEPRFRDHCLVLAADAQARLVQLDLAQSQLAVEDPFLVMVEHRRADLQEPTQMRKD